MTINFKIKPVCWMGRINRVTGVGTSHQPISHHQPLVSALRARQIIDLGEEDFIRPQKGVVFQMTTKVIKL